MALRPRLAALPLLGALLVALLPGSASATVYPDMRWEASGNPYAFTLADSVINNCVLDPAQRAGNAEGIGYRDLGRVGWPGATTSMMRDRIQGIGSWPADTVTEDSNAMEQVWFRDAGVLVMELGTNDVKVLDAATYRANVDWFIEREPQRPVVWINSNNPPFDTKVREFNTILDQEAVSHPNLKVVDWHWFLDRNGRWDVRGDGVHLADGNGCNDLFTLLRNALPGVPGDVVPRGYWYGSGPVPGGVLVNGWAASWVDPRRLGVKVNVRVNWQHFGLFSITAPDAGADDWANAASGRYFGVVLPPSTTQRVVCLDLLDAGLWTTLGCRWV